MRCFAMAGAGLVQCGSGSGGMQKYEWFGWQIVDGVPVWCVFCGLGA